MAKLVFDIETSALPLENFDEVQQEYLLREPEKIADETVRAAKREEILRQFNLWPFTAQVVCIAMLNAESQRGQVLFTAEDFEEDAARAARWSSCPAPMKWNCSPPFWDVAKHYDEIVTFNGRGFDVPFLYLRSAVLNVPDHQEELARLPLRHRAALRSRRAIHASTASAGAKARRGSSTWISTAKPSALIRPKPTASPAWT